MRVVHHAAVLTRTVADPAGLFELWADDWDLIERYERRHEAA